MNLRDLAAEFPRSAVHWRAQTLTANGDKALALAYIDARDVMDRLDAVCGPDGWQSEFTETAKGRVICRLGIRTEAGWVWKSDGAGDTDVEGEKGGISDALKRAAVSWGIGRYLYRLEAVWAPCETYERGGKKHWKAWKGDPWSCVRGAPKPPPAKPEGLPPFDPVAAHGRIMRKLRLSETLADLVNAWKDEAATIKDIITARPDLGESLTATKDARKADLTPRAG